MSWWLDACTHVRTYVCIIITLVLTSSQVEASFSSPEPNHVFKSGRKRECSRQRRGEIERSPEEYTGVVVECIFAEIDCASR